MQRIKENLNPLTRDDVYEWTRDLMIDKTFAGLQVQLDILEMVSETGEYRLSTPEEESKESMELLMEDSFQLNQIVTK